MVWRYFSAPFGAGLPDQDPDADGHLTTLNLRFPGQYFDKETGLHYNYFRYYDPVTGRYLSSDPLGLAAGVNTYGYVGQNPGRFGDPQGLLFDALVDLSLIAYDIYRLAKDNLLGDCDNFGENATALGADIGGLFLPGATGFGLAVRAERAAARAAKGAGKSTIKQRYTDAVQEATKRHNGNVTVQRDGVDLFRVHQPTSGHGTNVTQIVRRPRHSDGKVFPTPRDVPVRRTHGEQLERALKGDPRCNLRIRGGQ